MIDNLIKMKMSKIKGHSRGKPNSKIIDPDASISDSQPSAAGGASPIRRTDKQRKSPEVIIAEESKVFNDLVLPSLNQKLKTSKPDKGSFFGTESCSIADVQYYCEISTVLLLLEVKGLDAEKLPFLHKWFTKMRETHKELV